MEISPIVLIIWIEITVLLAGGLFMVLASTVSNKSKGKRSIRELLGKVQSSRETRRNEIRQGLAHYGLQGEALEAKVNEIDKSELKLYQRISVMYRNRSDAMLANLNLAVETASKPYYGLDLNLEMPAAGAADLPEPTGGDDASAEHAAASMVELEALKSQNEQLQQELAVTMDTIGRMLSEYSSLFDSEQAAGLDKQKIMQAFEIDEAAQADESAADSDELDTDAVDHDDIDDDDLEIVSEQIETDEDATDIDLEDELDAELADEEALADDDIDALLESSDNQDEQADIDIDSLLADAVVDDDAGVDIDENTDDDELDVPDDELLEISDDDALLDTAAIDEESDAILSDLIDLEADFGEQDKPAEKTEKAEKPSAKADDEASQTDHLEDFDIDALLDDNKK